jgi:hypothetical protein
VCLASAAALAGGGPLGGWRAALRQLRVSTACVPVCLLSGGRSFRGGGLGLCQHAVWADCGPVEGVLVLCAVVGGILRTVGRG